jgi:hypothetical protein
MFEIVNGGSECTLFRTKNGLFKEYCTKSHAVEAHNIQTELSSIHLAPDVYSRVCRVRMPEGNLSNYGFYTEEAEPLACGCDHDCDCSMNTWEARLTICEMVQYWTGWEFTDFHQGNFGFITREDQKFLVIVDCGHKGFVMEKDIVETA